MMCVGMKLLICLGILQSNAIEVMKITFDAHVQGDTDDDGDEDYVQSTDALSGLDKSFFVIAPNSNCNRCTMKACKMNGPNAPSLYVAEHVDGVGHRMRTILLGMAVAATNKMSFGGALSSASPQNDVSPQGVDFTGLLSRFFGDSKNGLLSPSTSCSFDLDCKDDVQKLLNFAKSISANNFTAATSQRSKSLVCGAMNAGMPQTWDVFFPDYVRDVLRAGLDAQKLFWSEKDKGKLKMAVHVRRGDLSMGSYDRVFNNSYYLDLIKMTRSLVGGRADVHVFSSLNATVGEQPLWSSSDFADFRKAGVAVHFEEADSVTAWAHFVRADVFLSSPSSFSLGVAPLSKGCVLFAGKPMLKNWVDISHRSMAQSKLEKCLVGRSQAAQKKKQQSQKK